MGYQIVAIGEVLWDCLPSGRKLGGAPANFAFHAQSLGADARIISRVGDDALGREILEQLQKNGLSIQTIEVDEDAPTGTVEVAVDEQGQPSYTIWEGVAWDRIDASPLALATCASADAVCFGSLARRSEVSRRGIGGLVAATGPGALRIFDVNLRPPFVDRGVIEDSLALANVLKLNHDELDVLAGWFGLEGADARRVAGLAARFDLGAIALTRGSSGSLIYRDGVVAEHPGTHARVVDTVGAGDAFTAVLTIGLLDAWSLDEINHRANLVAAFVCSREGATPELPDGLIRA
ncbi:carbohydrate kinase family protein [Tundrisphaera sp. TA3]|uniref:carbohydrate kinase family protein n=1 Tax=Tundrisphaera sp. TA3 TaxID=3435775 RepID=UPI003EBC03B6